jgi:xanthine dehydrogenase YagR molybdenum-binding subunit
MMAKTAWPNPDRRKHIGSRIARLDGPAKATGVAKYAYDMQPDNLAIAKMLQCPHASATVLEVDLSEAEKMPGYLGAIIQKDRNGNYPKISYAGDFVATLCCETEEQVMDALTKVKVKYDVAEPLMDDRDPANKSGRAQSKDSGEIEAGFAEADEIIEGYYGLAIITHCCLEAHGQVTEMKGDELHVVPSTQNVSGYAGTIAKDAGVAIDKIKVDCQYMGGGFGAKFVADKWGGIGAQLSKMTGRPVKLMLERDQEIKMAGHRPSAFANVKLGVKKDGTITAYQADAWGSGGQQRFRVPPIPYVFTGIPNWSYTGQGIVTNRGLPRAWRGPNHPQAALLTMCAFSDAAAKIGMDDIDFFKANLQYTNPDLADMYAEEIDKCAEMIDWKNKPTKRGEGGDGHMKRGLGMSIHTWGGKGHPSGCAVTINPDGSVASKMGTQDLGTGTRTIITLVIADTLGLDLENVSLEIGQNAFPASGASGGSSTVGGVSSSSRDAATQALNALLDKVAPELGVAADKLEAWDGKIQEIGNASNSMPWKEACSLLGGMSITKNGSNPTSDKTALTVGGVAGCQMADVSVDTETGQVYINEYVSAQDIGLVLDEKTAESQMFGGAIMGITYALFEEGVYDNKTGTMLNPDMEFYRLAGIGDIGKIKTHLMRGPKYEDRGVIGIGEPAVLSPGAAISNAVANAIGVRVPELPLTPDRVLNALGKGGVA